MESKMALTLSNRGGRYLTNLFLSRALEVSVLERGCDHATNGQVNVHTALDKRLDTPSHSMSLLYFSTL